MSIAEHISVFIAIVIGLAVSTLAINFHRLMVAGPRVRWDWLSPLLAVLMLFVTLSYWWASFYWHSGAHTLTIAEFLPDLANILLLFLVVAAVLPDEVPAEGLDLRAFYLGRARYLWTMQTLCIGTATLINLARSASLTAPRDWIIGIGFNGLFAVAFATLIFVRRPWWHGTVIVATLIVSAGINLVEAITG